MECIIETIFYLEIQIRSAQFSLLLFWSSYNYFPLRLLDHPLIVLSYSMDYSPLVMHIYNLTSFAVEFILNNLVCGIMPQKI